jgi:hypothetical protein
MMTKKVLSGFIAAVLVTAALAANVHLKQNKNPTFIDNGLYLSAVGSLTGLGNEDVVISVTAQGNVTATCTNPGGSTQPPGQNPAPVAVSGSVAIPADAIKNGTLSFSVRTEAPDPVVAGAPHCPNGNWTERITDISFTSLVLTVEQPAGTTVLTVSCTANTPTTNGSVQPNTVACTSV